MYQSNSPKTDTKNQNTVLDLFYEIESSPLHNFSKPKNTVVKYTKLPNFDSKASWCYQNYSLQPRLRRIVTLEDQLIETNRSLQPNLVSLDNNMSTSYPKRKIKIITIADGDDDDNIHHYLQLSKDVKKSASCRTTNKASSQNYQDYHTEHSHKSVSQVTTSRKDPAESKLRLMRSKDLSNISEIIKPAENKTSIKPSKAIKNDKTRTCGHKDTSYNSKDTKKSRINLSKNIIASFNNGKDTLVMKENLSDDLQCNLSNKPPNNVHLKKYQNNKKNYDAPTHKSNSLKPYIEKQQKQTDKKYKMLTIQLDTDTEVNKMLISTKSVSIETDPLPHHVDQITQYTSDSDTTSIKMDHKLIQTEFIKEKFDDLDIPNVSLIGEKKDSTINKEINYNSKSLPNLKSQKEDKILVKDDINQSNDSVYNNCSSYIIGRATVTYTTEQKIDFHVVNKDLHDKVTPSLNYPLNIVSIFKNEIGNSKSNEVLDDKVEEKHRTHPHKKSSHETSVGCFRRGEKNKLIKPSDIISTIRLNSSLIQSEYISEQFQRELNFIDSFFESLQYLERLSEKCFTDMNMHSWTSGQNFDVNNPECDADLTKFENGHYVDDTRTMATKSLCQLNLLIHNEQRRARDFLFVLKMQEDVLKDYIKSQMLWLENKKKQDNIDISALKKKQRGALLKLQHECGEMQRMRKALLTLSEKRKVALMKTKKNIEMKLKNNVDVEQIILGKKKLKRNTAYDRCLAPLKCFDLSSSGCEESTTSRAKSESVFYYTQTADAPLNTAAKIVTSAEKSIQTSDSVLGDLVEYTNTTAAENCIVVDGGYLNILFHNLSLPQIFSSGKQYEVNEEALRNIVQSSNTHNDLKDTVAIEKFMDQVKNIDTDDSSTASTAHSLVEEFDQYFKCLGDEEKSLTNSPECETHNCMLRECAVQTNNEVNSDGVCDHSNVTMIAMDSDESMLKRLSGAYGVERPFECGLSTVPIDDSDMCKETMVVNVGPLPVPAGEAAPVEAVQTASAVWVPSETSSNLEDTADQVFSSNLTPSQYTSPVMYEAEELRRQQLAIEREIKALEQQQCQLLVVREIPDKPPPPYTPPMEARAPKTPRQFHPDESMDDKIRSHFLEQSNDVFDMNDPFEAFVVDLCKESSARQRSDTSDKPWDDCNLLPQKSQPELKKVIDNVTTELKEVLSGVTRSYVSGVGSRRTDHIDDILFAEWRRCEPEWTSLHTDEATVKNQLFESIFQKILDEAVNDYKTTVCTNKHSDN